MPYLLYCGTRQKSRKMSYSTSTPFEKALAEAVETRESIARNATAKLDIERIKAFIFDNTGFKVINIILKQDNILTIKCRAKVKTDVTEAIY